MILKAENIMVFFEPLPKFDKPTSFGAAALDLGRWDEFARTDFTFAKVPKTDKLDFWIHDQRKVRNSQLGLPVVAFHDDPVSARLRQQFPGLTFYTIHHPANERREGDLAWNEHFAHFTDEAFVLFKLVYAG